MAGLTVRPLEAKDIPKIVSYFCDADENFLTEMGIDVAKLPPAEEFAAKISKDLSKPPEQKEIFFLIWEQNGVPVGHSNINKIVFGEEAFMHLHLWNNALRRSGLGQQFVVLSLPIYFRMFHLKKISVEPYALNPAPNRTLQKVGFKLECNYDCMPGWLNFHQPVNKYSMTLEEYRRMCP